MRELFHELDKLKKRILYLGTLVEESMQNAYKAFADHDLLLAAVVKEKDDHIDEVEIQVEEKCLQILALQQPVASDLRFVVTVLKINNDLERIGDLSVKIADKILLLDNVDRQGEQRHAIVVPEEFNDMFQKTIWILRKCLDAFVDEDVDLAYKVCIWDDEIDAAKLHIRQKLEEILKQDPSQHVYLALLLSVSRSLERAADHCTNIAEDVIYMMQGRIIRHDLGEIS